MKNDAQRPGPKLFYSTYLVGFAPVRAHLRVDDQLMCQREPLQSSKQSLAAAEVFNNPVPVLITIVVLGWRFVR